jgi:hypothetical protein
VDLVAAVVADEPPFEVVQPGKGALADPSGAAEPGAVLGLASGDLRCDPPAAEVASRPRVEAGLPYGRGLTRMRGMAWK